MSERLIAIDWGTSNFRAFLVDRTTGECSTVIARMPA